MILGYTLKLVLASEIGDYELVFHYRKAPEREKIRTWARKLGKRIIRGALYKTSSLTGKGEVVSFTRNGAQWL